MINGLLQCEASIHPNDKKNETGDLITEVFVMDNRGLNAVASDATSDYMQGDEAKWRKTCGQDAGQIFVDKVELDEVE